MYTEPKKPRDKVISFRLTAEELELIEKAAAAAGLTPMEYVRRRAMRIRTRQEPPTDTPEAEQMHRLYLFISQKLDCLGRESTPQEVTVEIRTILAVLTEFAAGRVHFHAHADSGGASTETVGME